MRHRYTSCIANISSMPDFTIQISEKLYMNIKIIQ